MCALVAGPAAADLFRWVDAQGVVNYSNVPPPQSVAAERIPESKPTVSVIPPPENHAELQQAAREAALLRRIEQLEDELAALRRAPTQPTVVYTYPVPAEVTYPATFVYPYPLLPWRPINKGSVHGHRTRGPKLDFPGFRFHGGSGGRAPATVTPRPGVTVRARF